MHKPEETWVVVVVVVVDELPTGNIENCENFKLKKLNQNAKKGQHKKNFFKGSPHRCDQANAKSQKHCRVLTWSSVLNSCATRSPYGSTSKID